MCPGLSKSGSSACPFLSWARLVPQWKRVRSGVPLAPGCVLAGVLAGAGALFGAAGPATLTSPVEHTTGVVSTGALRAAFSTEAATSGLRRSAALASSPSARQVDLRQLVVPDLVEDAVLRGADCLCDALNVPDGHGGAVDAAADQFDGRQQLGRECVGHWGRP